MKTRMAWFALVIPLLLVGNVAAYSSQSQALSATMVGGVLSPGVQSYSIRGGQLVGASILGTAVNPANSILRYNLSAIVSGTAATGTASFDLVTHTSYWSSMEVKGTVEINAMTPIPVAFPYGGAIPALFNGNGMVTVRSGSSVNTMSLNMAFESPYLNPFGGPIFFASSNGAVVVVAAYSQARIQWTDVQMGGYVTGTFGGAPVSGSFGMLVNSSEDLRVGQEMDQGSILFAGMSNPALNGAGYFFGHSTIPAETSASGCSELFGFPAGTCNETGLQSFGVFSMSMVQGGMLLGQYATTWQSPALEFSSSVSAFLSGPPGHH
jgi:hypothetical protein